MRFKTKIKQYMTFAQLLVWAIIGVVYFPIYIASWLLHIIARCLLALAYLGMLQFHVAKNVLNSVFVINLRML